MKIKLDTEDVIALVRARPVLWDQSHEYNKNHSERHACWVALCRQLVHDYDALGKLEKKTVEKKVQQRWKHARDGYVRMKRKKGEYTYAYHHLLTFLDNAEETLDDDGGDEDTSADDSDNLGDLHSTIAETPESKTPKSLKRKFKEEPPDFEVSTQMATLATHQVQYQRQMAMDDEDWCFFNSLMPTLNNFTNLQKLQFRSKVLKYLVEVETGNAADPICVEGRSQSGK